MSVIRHHDVSSGLLFFFAVCCRASALPPGFYPLGDLPGGQFLSHGYALSDDGSVAVGTSISSSGPEAFRWTAESGLVGIGDLPGGGFTSEAVGVSADGNIIVGVGSVPGEHSFRWTADGGMVDIAPSGGAFAVSADGTAVAGRSASQAYRWTEKEGAVGLGDFPGGSFDSMAIDVSDDGKIVVGQGSSASGMEAFRWIAQTGMVSLGDLPGGAVDSRAYGVSADGAVIVGFGQSASHREPFRWTAEDGMVSLATGSFGFAIDVSADGSTILGGANVRGGVFVWDEVHGMRSVQNMLGFDLSNWRFISPEGISDDGSTLIGYGIRHNGDNEAWIAVLPEPSTLAFFALATIVSPRRRYVRCL